MSAFFEMVVPQGVPVTNCSTAGNDKSDGFRFSSHSFSDINFTFLLTCHVAYELIKWVDISGPFTNMV